MDPLRSEKKMKRKVFSNGGGIITYYILLLITTFPILVKRRVLWVPLTILLWPFFDGGMGLDA